MTTEPLTLGPAAFVTASAAAAALVVFAVIQPGLARDKRTLGKKTCLSVEEMAFLWGFVAIAAGLALRVLAVALGISAGVRSAQIITSETLNGITAAAFVAATAAAVLQWARLRAAYRKESDRS